MPNTGVPLCNSAISVPQIGKPAIKYLVPSIGSSTQTYSASSLSLPNSSPTIPCWGKLALISRRITASAARSASVTGSKSWEVLLLSMLSDVRKNGRMVSPDEVARRPMKAVKSMTVTVVPVGAGRRMSTPCVAQSAPLRDGREGLSGAWWGRYPVFESIRGSGAFLDDSVDHEIESLGITTRGQVLF